LGMGCRTIADGQFDRHVGPANPRLKSETPNKFRQVLPHPIRSGLS
jgi:hypothetical protein